MRITFFGVDDDDDGDHGRRRRRGWNTTEHFGFHSRRRRARRWVGDGRFSAMVPFGIQSFCTRGMLSMKHLCVHVWAVSGHPWQGKVTI